MRLCGNIRDKFRLRTIINSLLKPLFDALAEEMRAGFKSITDKELTIMGVVDDIKAGWDNVKGAVTKAATDIDAAAQRIAAADPNNATLQAIAADMSQTATDLTTHATSLENVLNPPAAAPGGGAAPAAN